MKCKICGVENVKGAFCSNCGAKLEPDDNAVVESSVNHNTTTKNKKSKSKLLVGLILAIIIIIVVAIVAGNKISDKKYVSAVKDGTLNICTEVTIGDAFEYFFAEPSWDYVELNFSDDAPAGNYVEFTGTCFVYEAESFVEMRFYFDAYENYELDYFALNGNIQTDLELYAMLSTVYSDYLSSAGVADEMDNLSSVSVDNCSLVNDATNGLCVDVTYTFTNTSNEPMEFGLLYEAHVFQNGVECQQDYWFSSDNTKDVAPGAQFTFITRYILNDSQSDIQIDVNSNNFNDLSKVSKKYTLAELQTGTVNQTTLDYYLILGTYKAEDLDVQLEVTGTSDEDYKLTYFADGVLLEDIPCSMVSFDDERIEVMFDITEKYPTYDGLVTVIYANDSVSSYSFNAEIDSLTDSYGDYWTLIPTDYLDTATDAPDVDVEWYLKYNEFYSSDGLEKVDVYCQNDVMLCVAYSCGADWNEWIFDITPTDVSQEGEIMYYDEYEDVSVIYRPDSKSISVQTNDAYGGEYFVK